MTTTTELPAPGWFPDPEHADVLRWWDGAGWTEHRHQTAPVAAVPVAAVPVAAVPVAMPVAAVPAQPVATPPAYGVPAYGTPTFGTPTFGTPAYGGPAPRNSSARTKGYAAATVVMVVVGALALTQLTGGGSTDYSNKIRADILTSGQQQMQTALAANYPSATVAMTDASCSRTGSSQDYSCLAHFSVSAEGRSMQFKVGISATCDDSGDCQWRSQGNATPTGD